jgi:hypothetical protein
LGQTTIKGAGDEGELERGVAWPDPRFTDNGDGTVTDNLTGLIWLKNADCVGQQAWADALVFAANLFDGWTGDDSGGDCALGDGSSPGDWRVPNVGELKSLIDASQSDPALPSTAPFTGVASDTYWSSTTDAGSADHGWVVDLQSGSMTTISKSGGGGFYVWPVRGGQ